jgi:hypothetical protein
VESTPAPWMNWSIHELRHSCASLMLAMEVPLEVVSDALGHSSIRVTKDVYGHLLASSKMKAAKAMRKTLWLEELPNFEPLATELATHSDGGGSDNTPTSDSVRPSVSAPRDLNPKPADPRVGTSRRSFEYILAGRCFRCVQVNSSESGRTQSPGYRIGYRAVTHCRR